MIVVIGSLLNIYTMTTFMKIFSLGIIFPGGGFLSHVNLSSVQGLLHLGLAVFGFLSFLMSLFFWFATGNIIAPFVIWIGLAVSAAAMPHTHIHGSALGPLLLIICCLILIATVAHAYRWREGVKKRKQANQYLIQQAQTITPCFASLSSDKLMELSDDTVMRMRFLLDRALQPIDEFNGFEWLDQYQTAAIRYQLHFMGYALSMLQANYLPAFHSYMHQAQRNLIDKQADHRVWDYWVKENLWGNLTYNPDPVSRENIMYTGFCATQMAMYHAATGRTDYNETGSFALRHPSRKLYSYDLPALLDALTRDANKSPFHLIACEPNWIYPLCNIISIAAVNAEKPEKWLMKHISFKEHLENEFMDLQGRFIPCRSRYTGLSMPVFGGAMPQSLPCFFLNATMPDMALRQWLLLRRSILNEKGFQRKMFWQIDTGNYKFSRASAYAATALAATELGDEEVRNTCLWHLEDECPTVISDRHYYRPKASVWSHATEFMALSARKDGFRRLMNPQKSPPQLQPYIANATYPDVLPASATSADGYLKVVLYPGEKAGRQTLTINGLVPHASYKAHGLEETNIDADDTGSVHIDIYLNGRTTFEIYKIT